MRKQISALKSAYRARDAARLRRAARSLLSYDKRHPFASITIEGAHEILALAQRICSAPQLPF